MVTLQHPFLKINHDGVTCYSVRCFTPFKHPLHRSTQEVTQWQLLTRHYHTFFINLLCKWITDNVLNKINCSESETLQWIFPRFFTCSKQHAHTKTKNCENAKVWERIAVKWDQTSDVQSKIRMHTMSNVKWEPTFPCLMWNENKHLMPTQPLCLQSQGRHILSASSGDTHCQTVWIP